MLIAHKLFPRAVQMPDHIPMKTMGTKDKLRMKSVFHSSPPGRVENSRRRKGAHASITQVMTTAALQP
jgi:hypothetical protein